MSPVSRPTFTEEKALAARGFLLVAGLDEAGSGSWAGPVSAGAVILPPSLPRSPLAKWIRDSKTLSPAQRAEVAAFIKEHAVAWAVAYASPEEIDTLNIRRAGALAMKRAVEALAQTPQYALVDAFTVPGLAMPQRGIIRGDGRVKSIAAASIMAKTERDALMTTLDAQHPGYGFAAHKGYGTAEHRDALVRLGPCLQHRMTYEPVRLALSAALEKEKLAQ
ncbi:MAG: hypothetical protein RLZZ324_1057 [Candidatus Parcubacteria bacterium]